MPARWYDAGSSNEGVLTPAGRIVVLLGERALVDASGHISRPRVPSPETLSGVVAVPRKGGQTLIGYNDDSIFRFDDPMGAGTFIASVELIRNVDSAPDLLAVRTVRGRHWIDVRGKPSSFDLPVVSRSAFVDARRGVVFVPYAGWLATNDGGATWKRVQSSVERATQVGEASASDGVLRIGGDFVVAADTGVASSVSPAAEPPLVRWLRGTRMAPLEAAARGGVPIGAGRAAVFGAGMMMSVDLSTGEASAFVDANAPDSSWHAHRVWIGARAGSHTFFFNDPDARRVISIPRVPGSLSFFETSSEAALAPRLWSSFAEQAQVSVSGSGGLLVETACPGEGASDTGHVCVLQPNGSWRDYRLPGQGSVGAAADGGYFFGRIERDSFVFERAEPTGAASTWASIELPGGIRIQSLDEIDRDTLHAFAQVGDDADSRWASIRMPRGSAPVVRFFGFGAARGFRGKGIVVEPDALHTTLDGGAHWQTSPVPKHVIGAPHFVSEVGIATVGQFRIGWGEQAPFESAAARAPRKPTLTASGSWAVSCRPRVSSTPRPRPEPLAAVSPVAESVSPAWADRVNTVARVAVVKSGAKYRWTVQFIDGSEVPAKVRRAEGEGPVTSGDIANLNLSYAVVNRDRAFFQVSVAGREFLLRVMGSSLESVSDRGGVETAAIGADGAVTIATENSLRVWMPKEQPRDIAALFSAPTAVSAPSGGEVLLVYGEGDEAATRKVSFGRGASSAPLETAGWLRAPFSVNDPTKLARCDAKGTGHRLAVPALVTGVVNGQGSEGDRWRGVFTLRVADEQACLEAMELGLGESRIRADFIRGKAEKQETAGVVDVDCELGSPPAAR